MSYTDTLLANPSHTSLFTPPATTQFGKGVKTGRHAILEQFRADGFKYIFGNPGTVEQGFLDALRDFPDLQYVLTLQETVAVMMADGYARAMLRPAIVQLHSSPGLGNAIGALYQAYRGHAPLLVIGGDAGVKYQSMDSQMAADLVAMAKPVAKWSTMVVDPASTLRILRRAIKISATPPMGPVYVCLPQDVLDAPSVEPVRPTSIPSTRTVPDDSLVEQAARILVAAKRPMIFIGNGVAWSGAQLELTRVAELVGGEVWEADGGELNMRHNHPLNQGSLGHMFAEHSRPITTKGDVNLIVGTYMLPEVYPALDDVFAADAKVVHIDLNAYEIGKNHHVTLGLVSDPKLTLARLADHVERLQGSQSRAQASRRFEAISATKREAATKALDRDAATRNHEPLQFARFMEEFRKLVPDDCIVFDEALTNSPALTRYLPPTEPGNYFQTRGGSLGVGIPGAIGAKLACPKKTVFGFTGDGGAMYTIQALWTAARHNVDAKFVVCNNRSYRLLQLNISEYWKEQRITPHEFPLSFDLSKPEIRFDDMARSMGVKAARIERLDQIEMAISQAISTPGPFLLDVVLEGDIRPDLIGVRCGQ